MMKRVNKWLLTVVGIWIEIFLIDVVCVFVFRRPIFCLSIAGGEMTSYMGVGYRFDFFYPLGPIEEIAQSSSLSIQPWPFLGIVIPLVLYLIISALSGKQKAVEKNK